MSPDREGSTPLLSLVSAVLCLLPGTEGIETEYSDTYRDVDQSEGGESA